jgi:hypothetical protein
MYGSLAPLLLWSVCAVVMVVGGVLAQGSSSSSSSSSSVLGLGNQGLAIGGSCRVLGMLLHRCSHGSLPCSDLNSLSNSKTHHACKPGLLTSKLSCRALDTQQQQDQLRCYLLAMGQ